MQNGIAARFEDAAPVLERVQSALKAARVAGVPVLFVRVKFRAGYPEISPRNTMFGAVKQGGGLFMGADSDTEIHPDLAPQAGEWVLDKLRMSAFAGSPLETVLRAQNIEHLVLCGLATSGVVLSTVRGIVLSTVREAADKDYRLTVLADACADADEEVHRVLMTKVFPRQAEVMTVDTWEKTLHL